MDPLTRRTFLASLAATLAAGASPALAVGASPPPANVAPVVPLYVHHQCGGLLCFGKPYDDFSDMPEWTWRRHFVRLWMADGAQDLNAAALDDARVEFRSWNDVEADDWDEQAFLRWLDEPLPDATEALEQWMSTEGAPGQAAQLVDLLGVVTADDEDFGHGDGIHIQDYPWFGVLVGEQGLGRLRTAIAAHGLPIEIIETR